MSEIVSLLYHQCTQVSMKFIRDIEEENKNINVVVITINQIYIEKRSEAKIYYSYRKKFVVTADFQVRLLNSIMLDEQLHAF